nr:SDR family oxidoreductase [Saprospiraceae bacterium]
VAVLSRTASKVEKAVHDIESAGGTAMSLVADVLDQVQLEAARDKLLQAWGRIDILVNAAGGNMKGATIMPTQSFFDLSVTDFQKVTDLNLNGTVIPSLVFGEAMAKGGHGSIVNISSMAAQRVITRVVGYSASKAAIDNFTRWMAVELALKFGEGMRVNAIAPGFFIGEQNRRLLLNEDNSLTQRGQMIVDHTPMKRFGEPEELCGTLNWLCSEGAKFVTGIVVPVDGGFSAFSGI